MFRRNAPLLISMRFRAQQQLLLNSRRLNYSRIRSAKANRCHCQRHLFSTKDSTSLEIPNATNKSSPRVESIEKSWGRLQKRLLNHPPGSYTSQQWNEVDKALQALKPRLSIPQTTDITQAFELLDRLYLELQVSTAMNDHVVKLPLLIDLLHLAVDAWERSTDPNKLNLLTRRQVASKVEKCTATGPFSAEDKISSMLIDANGRFEASARAPVLAEALLESMLHNNSRPHDIDTVTMTNIIHLWSKSGQRNAPQKAQKHLEQLKDWYRQTGRNDQRPNSYAYASVISTWTKSGHHDAPRRALQLLQEMKDNDIAINAVVYNTVTNALSQSGQKWAAKQARALLNEMLRLYSDGNIAIKPDVKTFASVVSAYGRSGQAKLAEGLVQEMETRYERTGDVDCLPDTTCYNCVIDAYARIRRPQRASNVLSHMLQLYETGKEWAKPNITSWNIVLKAWAKSADSEADERAIEIVKNLEELYRQGRSVVRPNMITYTSLLGCFAGSKNPQEYTSRAEELIRWMEDQQDYSLKPSNVTYLSGLMVLRKAKEPERAEALLNKMLSRHQSGLNYEGPNLHHFNTVITAWVRSGNPRAPAEAERLLRRMEDLHMKEGLDTKPNHVTFNTLIDCISRSKDADAPNRAENVLRSMQEQFKAGDKSMKPTTISYTTVISTWARSNSKDASIRAEALLREMTEQGIKPNVKTFNTIMAGFSRHGQPEKVEEYFHKMEHHMAGPNRNFPAYITRLQAWAKVGEPERAASVLEEIIRQHEAGNLREAPNAQTFAAVLQAWLRSGRDDAAEQAERGLNDMHELAVSGRFDCHPNSLTYGCVISAYARSKAPNAAERAYCLLERLQVLYAEREEASLRPSLLVYTEVLSILARTSDSQWRNTIDNLLQDVEEVNPKDWRDPKQRTGFYKLIASLANSSEFGNKRYYLERILQMINHSGVRLDRSSQEVFERWQRRIVRPSQDSLDGESAF